MIRVIAMAILSGVALQLAAPPLELWPLSFVALVPVLHALAERSLREWTLAGVIVGLVNAACLVDGVIKWGPLTALALTALAAGMVAIPFAIAGWLAPRLDESRRPYAFVIAWVLVWWGIDEFIYTPVSLATPVALGAPAWLAFAEYFGALGLEAAVAGVSCVLASALRRPRSALLLPLFAIVPLAALLPAVDAARTGRIVGLQPNVHWSMYQSTGWSLERRATIEERLDEMTREASALGGTIVWPENGNALPNAQLARRTSALTRILADSDADLLTSGRELADGREYLSVVRFTREGVAGRARKANLVPFAESDLDPGSASVIESNAGRIGISVCFDSLFSSHARALVRGGAEQLVVTTDDTSFGKTTIPRRHLAYSIMRAAEVGRSLVFVSNEGPGVSYDPVTRSVRVHSGDGLRAIYAVDVPLTEARTLADRGLRHALPALLLALVLLALRARVVPGLGPSPRLVPLVLAPLLSLALGVGTDLLWRARTQRLPALTGDFAHRARARAGLDALGPLFKQSEEKSCGAAALAFALTLLGDLVFEDRLLPALVHDEHRGTSMAELARAAEARHFSASAWRASEIEALRFGPGIVHVLHMSPSHYVVAFNRVGEEIHVFDPAIGAVLRIRVADLVARWSGYALELTHRPVVDRS
jgi:apolipoprotein N-acyltransferase